MSSKLNSLGLVKQSVDQWLNQVNYGDDLTYKPSAFALAFVNFIKLVNLVYEQAIVPTHILNQDKFQAAINTQFYLMNNAASAKVRSDAANSLLSHLKQPENKQINLNIGVQETDYIKQLQDQVYALATAQKVAIDSNISNAKQVAESRIIQAEVQDVE